MKHGFVVAAGCAAILAGLVGCSSQEPDSPASSGGGKVTFGSNDAGPVTSVKCETKDGLTTISIEGKLHSTVVVTEGQAPAVKSVSIGEVGSDGPALMYSEGVSSTPVVVSRDGKNYTVTGNGLGSNVANRDAPVDTPFDIAVTCP
ncbi:MULTISPECIES: lipoprotein LpqH [Mycolicibacterium]|uniref:lipoprotein LpqH n=1 Tax=Mycolicibacterium TaxID=1866885 RepID=UPI00095C52A4|nr:lipoprotein LpqH [Mycolicibacterium mageritense]MBN3458330.1 lipoprotein LpqH [Mycobacterium sp. DSM 3803]OKH75088.1 hypothetical protein EB73_04580 [Mycobacterium sp. SWH-M3]